MEAPKDDAVTAFSMLDLIEHDDSVEYIFLNNGVRFFVTIKEKDLEGEGDLVGVFNDFRDDLEDPEKLFQFEEWVLQPLEEFMTNVATPLEPDTRKPVTLRQYFCPPTFAFRLVNQYGKLYGVQEYDLESHSDINLRIQIVDSLPDKHSTAESHSRHHQHLTPEDTAVILRSTLPQVPLISACDLERVDDGLSDEALSDMPTKVRHASTGELFFFKGGAKNHGHHREMEILDRIIRSNKFDPPFRTSRLAGLVVWDKKEASDVSLIGFLLEYIPGNCLEDCMDEVPMGTKRKWMAQVDATVRQLHELGNVWGDVKPDNVMINTSGDAVVIDFGGGYTPAYIPLELQQTKEGDLMGLEHMRATMGIRQKG